jgi:hypothetical protein
VTEDGDVKTEGMHERKDVVRGKIGMAELNTSSDSPDCGDAVWLRSFVCHFTRSSARSFVHLLARSLFSFLLLQSLTYFSTLP